MIYGYARVSTKEQNLERQTKAIKDYCIDNQLELEGKNIIADKQSGKDFKRPQYVLLREKLLRDGDILIIKELDRLGRNMEQTKEEWQLLIKKGVDIIVIDTPILNTRNKSDLEKKLIANIVFELLTYMAEKDRERIRKTQAEGIAIAKAKGIHLGRPRIDYKSLSNDKKKKIKAYYPLWIEGDITALEFMDTINLKRSTFYKVMKQYKEAQQHQHDL